MCICVGHCGWWCGQRSGIMIHQLRQRWHKDWAWLAQRGPGERGIETGLNPAITDITLDPCHLSVCPLSRVNNKKLAGYFLISLLAWWSNLLPGVIWNIQFQTDLNGACGAHYYQSITGLLCIQSLAWPGPGSPHSEYWGRITPGCWVTPEERDKAVNWHKSQIGLLLIFFFKKIFIMQF